MHIKVLGTAAAEGWPALFCACEACRQARALRGKNIRTRASILIDGTVKVDLPPDTYHHVLTYNLDLSRLEHLFFTHTHHDHFAISELHYWVPPFAYDNVRPLRIYGNSTATDFLRQHLHHLDEEADPGDAPFFVLKTLNPFETIEAAGIRATPIIASHKADEMCLNYIFEAKGRAFLYTCDTGWYQDQRTWDYLKGVHLDMLLCECTYGPLVTTYGGHFGLEDVVALRDELRKMGAFSDGQVVATHFSHGCKALHEDLEAVFLPRGVQIAYDGMELEV